MGGATLADATDTTGRYRIDGLAAGEYRLAFVAWIGALPTLYLGADPPVQLYATIDAARTIMTRDPQGVAQIYVDLLSGEQIFPWQFLLPLIMR